MKIKTLSFIKKLVYRIKILILNILYWLCVHGLYLLIRFYGTSEKTDWAVSNSQLIKLWLSVGTLFGIAYWILVRITENRRFRRKPYINIILFKSAGLVIMSILCVFVTRLAAFYMGRIEFSMIIPTFFDSLFSKRSFVFILYVGIQSIIISFIRQMRRMVGNKVLLNLLLGKYFHPKNEERIFMFLDLKSSTTHAEKLGSIKFSRLIQDCFDDLTESIIKNNVEVYQYIGDEAVLTWKSKEGLLRNNCLEIFFDFDRRLNEKKDYYTDTYGFVPQFKAGVNIGEVTAAEVGILKRDISYLSIVLNTAARMQEKCNEFKRRILVSKALKDSLYDCGNLKFEFMGSEKLRGREEVVDIYSVEKDTVQTEDPQ